ncbi:hypothetical protein HPB50_018036 [Hyalomma asiaticum]|uniref:Uncharacterized protein n=1 Tax=Hyalomma asiaticum TaxID=266040 RepID=A0ACB7S9X7_HYAAI|nr:hypothetical protein HPB50_018036 [Hyalomma asiaticum]
MPALRTEARGSNNEEKIEQCDRPRSDAWGQLTERVRGVSITRASARPVAGRTHDVQSSVTSRASNEVAELRAEAAAPFVTEAASSSSKAGRPDRMQGGSHLLAVLYLSQQHLRSRCGTNVAARWRIDHCECVATRLR